MESDPENSIDSQAAEDEEDETSKKLLKVETNRTNSLVSDAEDSVETCDSTTSSTCRLDLLQSATEYTSESREHHAVLCSENVADSGASNAPGTEAAAAMSSSCCTFAATATLPEQLEISENTYYVYFSSIPPGKTSDPLALTDAAYKRREVNDISRAGEIMKSAFTNRTIIRLRDLGIAEEKCKKLAHLVMNGNKMKINADVDEPRSTEAIHQYYRYWTEIESYQCLLIYAPEIGNTRDSAERKQEMKNFCLQAFPEEHFNVVRLNRTVLWREVSNCTHVKQFIQDFFGREDGIRAKRALHVVIVFFGHGSEQGFRTGQQDNNIMPLDNIISLVKNEWRKALLKEPEDLPVKVEIIFTQCYGHLHGSVEQSDRFKVTEFTTPDLPVTTSIEEDAAGGFVNNDLTPYAVGPLRDEVCNTETWRQSDNDEFVDLSSIRRLRNSCDNQPADDPDLLVEVSVGGLPSTL